MFLQKCMWERAGLGRQTGSVYPDVNCRVQLDVMWAREPHTVSTNWSRAKADYEVTMRYLSIRPETLLPQLGSETLRDRVGMAEALATLTTSLRPDRNSANIQ